MRIRSFALLSTLLLGANLGSCAAGPHQLRRTVDDWDHNLYVNSPWLDAVLWAIPVIPTSFVVAIVCDFLVTDAYAFWFDDAWDGNGTGFEHLQVQWTDLHVRSLMIDRSGWTRTGK